MCKTMINEKKQDRMNLNRSNLESLLEYVELTTSCVMLPQPEVPIREDSSSERHGQNTSSRQNGEEAEEYALRRFVDKGVFEKVAETLVSWANGPYRVTKNMDESFLEDDYYELVYRPSQRPGPLQNILSSTPSYDSGMMNSTLSRISEMDERTVLSFEMQSRRSSIGRSPSRKQPKQMGWTDLLCGILAE